MSASTTVRGAFWGIGSGPLGAAISPGPDISSLSGTFAGVFAAETLSDMYDKISDGEPSGSDAQISRFQVSIEGAPTASHNKTTTDIRRNLGTSPSTCNINIPIPDAALDHADSSWFFSGDDIKIGAAVEIWGNDEALFRGFVRKKFYSRVKGLTIECADARWQAEGVRVFGGWVLEDYMNPESTRVDLQNAARVFQPSFIPIFNPGGRPNCYNGDDGVPFFAPHPGFNLSEGDDPDDDSPFSASYWTLDKIIQYLLWAYASDTVYAFPQLMKRLPDSITIPSGITSGLSSATKSNFDQGRSQGNEAKGVRRKGREVKANGMSVLGLVESVLNTAGGNSLYLEPTAEGSALRIKPTWYMTEGLTANIAASGNIEDYGKAPIFQSGSFEEDGTDFVSACYLAGQSEKVERRLSSWTTDPNTVEIGLQAAWSFADELAFRQTLIQGGAIATSNWEEAINLYPYVGAMYKIKEDYDYTEATTILQTLIKGPRLSLPQQLSFRAAGRIIDFALANFPLYIETLQTFPEGQEWVTFLELNGLTVLESGLLFIPGLRSVNHRGYTWDAGKRPGDPVIEINNVNVAAISWNPIRINLALKADSKLEVLFSNTEHPDVAIVAEDFERVQSIYSDIYRRHIITDSSWPQAETAQGTVAEMPFIDPDDESLGRQTNRTLFDDQSMAEAHVDMTLLEEGRVRKTGTLICRGHTLNFHPGFPITKMVDKIGNKEKMVNGVIGSILLRQSAGEVRTEMTLI